MSYSDVYAMQRSASLMNRCISAVATETTPEEGNTQFAPQWVNNRSWDIAATPGWAAKWESAELGGVTDPGASEVVITDADILSRVQQLLTSYPLSDITTPV